MIAVFARANHPLGWGMPVPPSQGNAGGHGTAHGYVVLLVRCKKQQIAAITARMNDFRKRFEGIPKAEDSWGGYSEGQLGTWFGGQFELIAVLPGNVVEIADFWYGKEKPPTVRAQRFWCRGDNRFVGLFEADEVLSSE